MKNTIIVAMLLAAGLAQAQQATDVTVRQRNSLNTGWLDRFLSPPAGGANGILYINGATIMPDVLLLGTGLTISGGVLNAAGTAGATGPAGATGATGPAGAAGAPATQAWADITGKPTTTAGYGITDGTTPAQLASALTSYATVASLSGYATTTQLTSGLATKYTTPAGSTAQYLRGDGSLATFPTIPAAQINSDWTASSGVAQILNKPTIPNVAPFNYGFPAARTLAVSTSYQATDPSKAAIIYPSLTCVNSTTAVAASACTIQVRINTSAVTCSTGTVYYTQSLAVALGLLLTQTTTQPVPIFLPAGAYFAICPSTGTFTVSAVEQTAG